MQQKLIKIGYWYSEQEPWLPHPKQFQQPELTFQERDFVLRHLKLRSVLLNHSRGSSWCRFGCKQYEYGLGGSDCTDGTYVFPDGLSHYVKDHNVRLPPAFLDHVIYTIKLMGRRPVLDKKALIQLEWDESWWRQFA